MILLHILATNGFLSFEKSMTIEIRECAPSFTGDSGTSVLYRNTKSKVLFMYQYYTTKCEEVAEKFLDLNYLRFIDSSGNVIETVTDMKDIIDTEKNVLSYQLPDVSNSGEYTVAFEVIFNSKKEAITYDANIKLTDSLLTVPIVNGEDVSVPQKIRNAGVIEYYNITVDASNAYHPANENVKKFTFKWFCRIVGLHHNMTLADRSTNLPCPSYNRTSLSDQPTDSNGVLYLDSSRLNSNLTYEVIVEVESILAKVEVSQKITLLEESLPTIEIK